MTRPSAPAKASRLRARVSAHATLLSSLFIIALLFIVSAVQGDLGRIGVDNDDAMRLVQIKDFLAGQSWFDTNQYRLGPKDVVGGTDMHWSRLPDVPIILLTYFFDIFLSQPRALQWAYSVWPPLSAGILIFAAATAARYLSVPLAGEGNSPARPYLHSFTLVLLGFFIFAFYRFKPGAIDHHNVQMGILALSMALLCDPARRFRTAFGAGLAAALSLAIGVEVYIFIAVICAYVALNWGVLGDAVARPTQGFGVGLALGLAAAFVGTIAPAEYGRVLCDSLSLITVSAGAAGGLGLALAATIARGRGAAARFGALASVGGICLALLSQQAPQCLDNPLSSLPEKVDRIWLSNIGEARGLSLSGDDALMTVPYTLGAPCVALILLVLSFWRNRSWRRDVLIALLLLSALALTLYQNRFFVFAYVFSILPLARWVGGLYAQGLSRVAVHKASADENPDSAGEPSNVKYLGALALSIPLVWGAPGLLLAGNQTPTAQDPTKSPCYDSAVITAMNRLPTGLIASTSNGGAPILQHTEHSSLSGNYHRNIVGISAQIDIATSAPDEAHAILRQRGVDYVHFCRTTSETDILIKENPDGLYGQLMDRNVPPYLSALTSVHDGNVTLYKVD